MSSDTAIKVENLSKCYQIYAQPRDRLKQFVMPRLQKGLGLQPRQYCREFWALRDVSFEVKKGETVGIVGRNGSGKSTLLQMICGTLNSTHGSIQTNGRIAALLELGSGFNPEFTGCENVYLNGAILGLSRAEIDERFDSIAGFADIGEFIERPVKTYSSGMYVRLAFAVQAMVDPEIFVVDEALAVGDEKFQRKCFARLEELKSEGAAILFVSHSSGSIVELCEKTLLLDHGRRLMFGPAPDAIRAYQKLLYASADTQERLVRDLLAEDLADHNLRDEPSAVEEVIEGPDASSCQAEPLLAPHGVSDEAFDPGLVPETTTVYPTQGAIIDSIQIINADGLIVNVLQSGEDYRFVVSGRFFRDFPGVYFGIHIKSISGIVITGQRFPEEGSYLENVLEGQEFKTSFSFRMDLLPGAYFAGSGVWSSREPSCAHRIVDAIMFRVNPVKAIKSFGCVDLMSEEPVVKFDGVANED
ncbi:ABC transporter ATP-binding protein [Uliginosibacterium sp. 31-16]|uniref:ABC transporter ATP-binding protein n=1 Tax=Uliginosibacterium sp. 31-16 TaxID=3068315 RepID=UPI00273E2A05|nr:ABC transporter ATP-binding protein [Uliginosibacterium sp. 31-16]MDP5238453.1 ABC transporter ATP-binding protein [Uliginosibacterium sp. 31-16]